MSSKLHELRNPERTQAPSLKQKTRVHGPISPARSRHPRILYIRGEGRDERLWYFDSSCWSIPLSPIEVVHDDDDDERREASEVPLTE